MNNKLIKIVLAALLLLCLFDMPYGFFQFVRFAAVAGFAYLGYSTKEQKRNNEMFLYFALAILFQPFVKIALGRTMWNIVDLIIGIGLLISAFNEKRQIKTN